MKMNKKGFTLIELLIVVAIIAILAAIAIPQFSSYRIRGYNSAATADLRNARTAEEAFFSDWQVYASSILATGGPGAGAVLTNTTPVPQVTVGQFAIVALTSPSAATTFNTGVSQNVGLVLTTSANGGSFTGGAKNAAGDRCFGMDSDFTPIYWVNGPVGSPMLTGGIPLALASATVSEVAGATGAAPCNGPAPATTVWAAL
ncbi:MAG: prepilin-type N-terminal cleavage/methylation domain-containing protein [Nitrospirota bacterium]